MRYQESDLHTVKDIRKQAEKEVIRRLCMEVEKYVEPVDVLTPKNAPYQTVKYAVHVYKDSDMEKVREILNSMPSSTGKTSLVQILLQK